MFLTLYLIVGALVFMRYILTIKNRSDLAALLFGSLLWPLVIVEGFKVFFEKRKKIIIEVSMSDLLDGDSMAEIINDKLKQRALPHVKNFSANTEQIMGFTKLYKNHF